MSFFLFFCELQQKIETIWRNYLFELQNQAERNTRSKPTAPHYSSATATMLVIFGRNVISALFQIAGIHSTTSLKTYKQAQNFFNPENTQSLSEEFF